MLIKLTMKTKLLKRSTKYWNKNQIHNPDKEINILKEKIGRDLDAIMRNTHKFYVGCRKRTFTNEFNNDPLSKKYMDLEGATELDATCR